MSIWTSFRRWWNNQNEIEDLTHSLATVIDSLAQARFLLDQAPMLDAPEDRHGAASYSYPAYIYIHPRTFSCLTNYQYAEKEGISSGLLFGPSQIKWVRTFLMPQGRVILSPNAIPNLDLFLER